MPRRGWSAVPTPAGWFEVIRGPRPPSVQWPPGKGKGKKEDVSVQSVPRGRWQQGAQSQGGRWKRGPNATSQSSPKVRSLEAALAALGPEESSAKTEIGLALKRVREQATAQVVFDPEARMAAGRDKVARLEQAIAAMGDLKGPAMDALVTALKRAQQEAQEMPLESQIQAREAFLERARKRLVHIDQERAAEVLRIQECERRLEELRVAQNVQQAKPSVPPVDAAGEVARLQQMVSELQRQLQHQGGLVVAPAIVPSRIRKREDYVPSTDQEFLEWMADRQEDMNAALMAGNPAEAARVSGVITDATRSLQSVTMQPSMITNMVN